MSPSEGGGRRLHVHAVIDSLVWGGAELLLADFAAAAREADMDVTVGYLHYEDPSPGLDKLRAMGIEPTLVEIPRMVNPRAQRMVRRHIAEVAPDVVHTHLGYSHALGGLAARRLGIPSVATIHVMDWERTFRGNARARVMGFVRSRTAARVITVSDAARQWLVELGWDRPERIVTIHNGIAAEPRPGAGAAVRSSLGIASDEQVAAMVTVLRPGKGHDVAAEAVRIARERHPGLRLLVAGGGPSYDDIAELMRPLGSAAIMTGHREDVMELLDAADILLHPSSVDAFPTTLIEAGAAGVPVLSTRVGGIPEIVLDGESGILLDAPPRAEDFAAELDHLLAEPALRARLGDGGRRRYEEEFTAARWAERLRALYEEVLGGGSGSGASHPVPAGERA
jgi:glycosyltransferase involved in cell wall biosynthesis